MTHFKELFLLTGSNIEPRLDYLEKAELHIAERIGSIVKSSSIFESEPWGFTDGDAFLNKVLLVETELTADEVLSIILDIEKVAGRQRTINQYSSRTLDIDILYFGDEIIKSDRLVVPHPRLQERRFTLMPLAEIAADFIHPVLKTTNAELLQTVNDDSKVWTFQAEKL